MSVGIILAALGSYLIGAVPFSQIASLHHSGTDLRAVGTGTVSGTGLYRVGGFGALVVGGTLDLAKGALAAALAGDNRIIGVVACGAAVAGHCWSVFLRGAGGRGISPAIGALLVLAWPGAALLLGALAVGRLLRATGLISLVADVGLVAVMTVIRGPFGLALALAAVIPMLVKRLLGNSLPASGSGFGIYRNRLLYDADQRHAA